MISKIHFVDALKLASAFFLLYIGFQALVTLKSVLLIFFTAVIVAIAMDQAIMQLERRGFSRFWATVSLYVLVAIGILFAVLNILPSLANELRIFVANYDTYGDSLMVTEEVAKFDITPYLSGLSGLLADSPTAVLSAVFKTANSLTSFLAVFFVAFFLTLQKGGVRSFVIPLIPLTYQVKATLFWDKLQARLGSWLWGKTLSSLLVGVLTFLGLWILEVPYALSLALVMVLLNYIPFVGPIIAVVSVIFLGLNVSLFTAIMAGLLYLVINGILEPFIFGPIFMKKAVQINPAFLILSVISGAYLGGVLGIVISIPLAAIVYLAITEYWSETREEK